MRRTESDSSETNDTLDLTPSGRPTPSAPRPMTTVADEDQHTLSIGQQSLQTLQGSPPSDGQSGGPTAFLPGALLGGRYRIVRFISRGGMGEVYEAEDQDLGGRVALKTIRPQMAGDERVLERFRREIQLARQVTHPNVCRIFDIGYHTPSTAEGGRRLLFLTMELLPGDTLSARLRRGGPMREAEALPLLRQMTEALSAAHEAGVVHRDFKSSNVLLVPSRSGLRAVVTDFGLACSSSAPDGSGVTVSNRGAVVGTPAYMAPEQVEGREVTAAADVYALGVVMYEMLTGKWPFVAETAMLSAMKRLHEAPTSPRVHVPTLDPRWEATILHCLEREPGQRFGHVREVVRSITGEDDSVVVHGRRRKRARKVSLAGALVLCFGAGVLMVSAERYRTPDARPAVVEPGAAGRRTVAVLGFKNLSGRPEADWLSTAIGEMLDAQLSAGEQLRLIPGENVARMRVELQLPETETFAPDTLSRIRGNLGADLVVVGSYVALGQAAGGKVQMHVRVQDAAAGQTVASVTETGTESELIELVSRTGGQLRQSLGLHQISAADEQAVRASLLGNGRAARLYSEGLDRLRNFDALGAKEKLAEAVKIEAHPLVHAALAEAWSRLGFETEARAEAKSAYELSAGLPRSERLWVEGLYRKAAGEWDRAVRIHETLIEFYPDNLDYGLALASVQTLAGRGREALQTVEKLRALPEPERDDPRIDLAEARAAQVLSDYRRQADAAGKAAAKGQARGARLLVAEAKQTAWWGLQWIGPRDVALKAAEEARAIYAEAGDRGGVARALEGVAYLTRGEATYAKMEDRDRLLEEARRLYEESLALSREVGDKRTEAGSLRGVGLVLLDQQKYPEAKERWDLSLAAYREIGDRNGEAWVLTSLGYVLMSQDRVEDARQSFEQARDLFQSLGAQTSVAHTLTWIAGTLVRQGELEQALQHLEESLAQFRASGSRDRVWGGLMEISGVLQMLGRLGEAKRRLEELNAEVRAAGDKEEEAATLIQLAVLHWQLGDLPAARRVLEQARGLEAKEPPALEANVRSALAPVLLEEGDLEGARRELQAALAFYQERGYHYGSVSALSGLRYVHLHADELPEMRRTMDQTLELVRTKLERAKQLGEEYKALTPQVLLLLAEGKPKEAEAAARQGIQTLSVFKGASEVPWMQLLLASALLDQGRAAEARQEVDLALPVSARSEMPMLRLMGVLLDARTQTAAGGDPGAALASLQAALDEARRLGLGAMQLEIRLAMGQIELASGARDAGAARLREVQQEAASRGFKLQARHASRLLEGR